MKEFEPGKNDISLNHNPNQKPEKNMVQGNEINSIRIHDISQFLFISPINLRAQNFVKTFVEYVIEGYYWQAETANGVVVQTINQSILSGVTIAGELGVERPKENKKTDFSNGTRYLRIFSQPSRSQRFGEDLMICLNGEEMIIRNNLTNRKPITYSKWLENLIGKTTLKPVEFPNNEFKLSNREAEIANMIMGGITSNKEIGEKLCITEGTVRTHLNNLMTKCSITNRIELIRALKNTKVIL